MRCPNCGEEGTVRIVHHDWVPEGAEPDEDGGFSHSYCTNCDYGLCSGEC